MPDSQPTPASMSSQERVARDYLARARFRKARDEFKLLCKVDREKFLPLFVEANVELAREMMGNGMVEEARQVVNYLKTIAPPGAVLALRSSGPGDSGFVGQDLVVPGARTVSERQAGPRPQIAGRNGPV